MNQKKYFALLQCGFSVMVVLTSLYILYDGNKGIILYFTNVVIFTFVKQLFFPKVRRIEKEDISPVLFQWLKVLQGVILVCVCSLPILLWIQRMGR